MSGKEHAHSTGCWWDLYEARWMCAAETVGPVEADTNDAPADDPERADPLPVEAEPVSA